MILYCQHIDIPVCILKCSGDNHKIPYFHIFGSFYRYLPVVLLRTEDAPNLEQSTELCKTLDKEIVKLVLNNIVRELEATKANNAGVLLYGAITRLVANKGGKITRLTKDMVMCHLKKLNNNNNTDLVVEGLNSTVLLDCSPANQNETSSILTFATRISTTASTLTTVTFNSDENSSVSNNYLTDRPDQHETEQTQFSGEKGGDEYKQK